MQSQPPDQGSTARLIALLICREIQEPRGPQGPKNLIEVGDRIELQPEEWGGTVTRAIYACYAGPFGEHKIRFRIVDQNTHAVVRDAVVESEHPMPEAPQYELAVTFNIHVTAPGNFEVHLLIDTVDIGHAIFSFGDARH